LFDLSQEGVGAFIARDNFHYRRDIEKAYLKTIGAAKSEIYLVNPYFLPGRKLKNALLSAAKRGVRVNLMVGVGQFKWFDYAVKAIYGLLLKGGVVLYEYIGSELHGKILVADQQWFTVGSSNCDPLSFLVNHEANLIVLDKKQASWLIEKIDHEIKVNGRLVDSTKYFNRSLIEKISQWFMYVVSRILTKVLVQGVKTKVTVSKE
jgi:cardiolipin synthase